MPTNPAAEADGPAEADPPAEATVLAGAVLAGVVAGGLPPLDDEALLQPAARATSAANTAVRAAAAPMALFVLFTVVPLCNI